MATVLYREYVRQSTSVLLPTPVNCLCLLHLQWDLSECIRSTLQRKGFSVLPTSTNLLLGKYKCLDRNLFPLPAIESRHSPEPRNLCSLLIHVNPTLWTPASCVQWYREGHFGSEIETANTEDTELRKTHPSNLHRWTCVSTYCPVSINILLQVLTPLYQKTELDALAMLIRVLHKIKLQMKYLMNCFELFLSRHICTNPLDFVGTISWSQQTSILTSCFFRKTQTLCPTQPPAPQLHPIV